MMGDFLNVSSAYSLHTSANRSATAAETNQRTCKCSQQVSPIQVTIQQCEVKVSPGVPLEILGDAVKRLRWWSR